MVARSTGHPPDAPVDRLAGLRAPRAEGTVAKKAPVRIELLLGMVLVAGGVLVALAMGRDESAPTTEEQAVVEAVAEEVGLPVEDTGLLADETEVALALEAGQFPPDLAAGDRVMVTVVPDFDTGGEVRSLESTPVVTGIARPDDMTGRWVITLRANRAVPKVVAGSKSVILSVVGGGS